jgi:ATP-dependent Clp protease protease subunit
MLYPPYIIERSSRGERTYDIFRLTRIVFLNASRRRCLNIITPAALSRLIPEDIYMHNPGRVVSSRMAIHDTIRHLRTC